MNSNLGKSVEESCVPNPSTNTREIFCKCMQRDFKYRLVSPYHPVYLEQDFFRPINRFGSIIIGSVGGLTLKLIVNPSLLHVIPYGKFSSLQTKSSQPSARVSLVGFLSRKVCFPNNECWVFRIVDVWLYMYRCPSMCVSDFVGELHMYIN